MALNVFEVALYAMILSGGQAPLTCERHAAATPVVKCSNGAVATEDEEGRIRYMDGTTVYKGQNGALSFSNGISSHWGSAGWVQFTNNVSVRRTGNNAFKSNGGLTCRPLSDDRATCDKAG